MGKGQWALSPPLPLSPEGRGEDEGGGWGAAGPTSVAAGEPFPGCPCHPRFTVFQVPKRWFSNGASSAWSPPPWEIAPLPLPRLPRQCPLWLRTLVVQTALLVGCQPNNPNPASLCDVRLTHGKLPHPRHAASWECPSPAPALAALPLSSPLFTEGQADMQAGDRGEAGEVGTSRCLKVCDEGPELCHRQRGATAPTRLKITFVRREPHLVLRRTCRC